MKNSITKLAITISIALFSFNAANATSTNTTPQVAETIIIDGKIYPMVNLPSVEVNASGTLKPVSLNTEDVNLKVINSSKMVMVAKYKGVYMPSVLLAEANVVASRIEASKNHSIKGFLSNVFSFVYHYASHFGVIH